MFVFGVHAGVFILAIIAYFMQLELYQLFEKTGLKPMKQFGLICGSILIFGSFYLGSLEIGNELFLISFLLLIMMITRIDIKAGRLDSLLPTLFGFIYVPFLLHYLIKIFHLNAEYGNSMGSGLFLTFWVVGAAVSTDIGGYLFGKILGKTKFSIISPQKTNEGVVGGVLFAAFIGLLLVLMFPEAKPPQLTWLKAILMSIPLSFAAIASDLIESAFKRQAGQKDSSTMIPGMGGVFDLCDSIVLTAPLAYLILKFFVF
jgi:phosphatidate cytidylyltransferase